MNVPAVCAGVASAAIRLAANALRNGLVALVCFPCLVLGQTPAARPYQVEAVFLFNFTQFVTWPADAFATANDPLSICVLGEDPFGRYLDDTVAGEKAQGRPLQVRRLQRGDDAEHCHIVFVGRSEEALLGTILPRLHAHNTLTVSDADDFGKRGGMVRFVVEDRRVRLRINVEAARAAGLTISSNLLRIAEIATTDPS